MNEDYKMIMKNVGKQLMNTIQMGLTYESWSKEFSYKEVIENYQNIKEQMKEIVGDITKLSVDELKDLGFFLWSNEKEDLSNLYLIPLWAFDLVPDGTTLTSIEGETAIKGQDSIDLDVRFGCIAYGLLKEIN